MEPFLDKAKRVIEKNRDVLEVFEELDRTGKFRSRQKIANEKKLNQIKTAKH